MDSPLTKLGRKQAQTLKNLLPPNLDHVYISPLSRAYETGEIAVEFEDRELSFSVHDELMEINFGDLQGIKYHEVPYDSSVIKRHVRFEEDILLDKGHKAETIKEFFIRTHGFFERMIQEINENNWENVVVFTHGGYLRSIFQHHLKLSDERFENTEIAILTRDKGEWNFKRLRDHIILE